MIFDCRWWNLLRLKRHVLLGWTRMKASVSRASLLVLWSSSALLCALGSGQAWAQLNENCTVSVLNRVVQVKPDGTWVLPNIPANFGQVRARATCVENSITRSGQSDLFAIPANGSVTLPHVQLGVVEQIPSSLALFSPASTLNTTGATTQIIVTAKYPDTSTKNVTAANTGTSYTNSNPKVATLSPDGLVTAVSSGTVIISALNEGALGLIRIQIALTGGDKDKDGIPDDVERANGLNPNDPTDGFADADNDGLTNKQELVDYGTNFQIADTDGDGINDGTEIANGSNPTDPNSPGQGIVSLEVTPKNFSLTVNTLLGEASQQLRVTGRRSNGSVVDLTTSAATNYSSSDLSICNFGTEHGRIFAGADGTCTITVTNGSLSVKATAVVQTFAPTALSSVDIPGETNGVDVNGNFAYVAAGSAGLQIVDVSNRNAPFIVGKLDTPGNVQAVQVIGNLAYVADGTSGLRIIDVIAPEKPISRGSVSGIGDTQDVAIGGNLAFVASGSGGLQVIDVRNPDAPTVIGTAATAAAAIGIDVSLDRQLVVIAEGSTGLQVVDVSDPARPTIVGSLVGGDAHDVVIRDQTVFVADGGRILSTVDISNPRAPILLTSTPPNTGGDSDIDLAVVGRFAFTAVAGFRPVIVPIIDVNIPSTPIPRTLFDFGQEAGARGIAADASFIYVLPTTANRLLIGQYLRIEDSAGIPPTVRITSPVVGDTVIEGASIPVLVEATDDVAVGGVSLIVNGQIVSTDTTSPYRFTFTVPLGVVNITISATTFDFGGNTRTDENLVLNVIPDPKTTVQGRVVDEDGKPQSGATVTCANVVGTTVADGTFSLPSVPSVSGRLLCSVKFKANGLPHTGSAFVTLVPGGISPIGTIVAGLTTPYPGLELPAGGDTDSITVVDVNEDGYLDMVTQGTREDVSILLGNGDGTFQAAQRFAVGESIHSGAVVDVDRDGHLDLVAAGSRNVMVLRGNGDGTFQAAQRSATRGSATSVAVADVNGDGRPDVVTADEFNNGGEILLGNGDGTFRAGQRFATGSSPLSVAVADMNGDGRPDVVTANSGSNDVTVLLGNGDGTFQVARRFTVGRFPTSVAVSDVNGDGHLDVVTANSGSNDVTALLGNGDGTFREAQSFAAGSSPLSVAVADVNGDGRLDIVTANSGTHVGLADAALLLGNGDGTFQAAQHFVAGRPTSIAVADVNGDARLDVLMTNSFNSVVVFLAKGNGTFRTAQRFATGSKASSLAVGDLNADGRLDVVTAHFESNDVAILLGNGDGTSHAAQPLTAEGKATSVAIADVNDDGRLDVVASINNVSNSQVFPGDVAVWLGNGNGTFRAAQRFAVGLSPESVAVADVNGDGRLDVVTANDRSDDVSELLGNGDGTFRAAQHFATGGSPASVAIADVNGDERPDIVTADFVDVAVLLGNGNGTFQIARHFAAGDGPNSVAIADVNSDGLPDVVTVNYRSNAVTVLPGNGDGTFREAQSFAAGDGPDSVAIADVNGDGRPDVITANINSEEVSVLLGNENGTFQAAQHFVAGVPAYVVVGDVNGDGRPDVITANYPNDIVVLPHQ